MGGGVMRTAAKVAGAGIVNTGLRGGVQVSPSSAENSAMRVASSRSASSGASVSPDSANQIASWDMVDDWDFAAGVDEEVPTAISGGGEPMARVLFGGVPSLEETKEATSNLKDALDKAYLSSPNSTDDTLSRSALLSTTEETKVCVAYGGKTTTLPKPAVEAFKLLNESPAVQSIVASIAADPSVWNAVLHNPAYMDFIRSHKSNYVFEGNASPRSCESSSVKIEEYLETKQAEEVKDPFLEFVDNFKASVVEMANKATDFFQSLFNLPSAEAEKRNAGSNYFEKTIGASLMGLAVMVIMVVLLKRI